MKHIKKFNEGLEDHIIDGERTDGDWGKSDASDSFLSPEEFLIDWEGKDDSTHPNQDIRDEWTKRINQLKIYSKMVLDNNLKNHH